jgi:hypothetical protein
VNGNYLSVGSQTAMRVGVSAVVGQRLSSDEVTEEPSYLESSWDLLRNATCSWLRIEGPGTWMMRGSGICLIFESGVRSQEHTRIEEETIKFQRIEKSGERAIVNQFAHP